MALISVQEAWELSQSGRAQLVDLRPPSEFAAGFPLKALSLAFSPKGLAERLDPVVAPGAELILLADPPDHAAAVAQLESGGYRILGLIPGLEEWRDAGLPVDKLELLEPESVPEGVAVVDVREPIEWETGHVPGAILVSLGDLEAQAARLPSKRPLAVICEAGLRSSTAASLLKRRGFKEVANVLAGTSGYRRTGLPLEIPAEGAR